jgi:DNA-binding transcriptional LysR family regulator
MNAADALRADELTVQQIRSFCVVFERQSCSAAAKELGFSVPTIWEQVRSLEKRYDARLFGRRGRRIVSTPAAEVLYQALRSLLAGLDSTFDLLREQWGAHPGQLTLVTGVRMMLEDLGRPLALFYALHPGVRLRLVHADNRAAEGLVVAGDADLGLTLEPGPRSAGEGVSYDRAYRIEFLALLPKRHPLCRRAELRLADLVAYPLVVGHATTYGRHLLDQALHREGLLDRLRIAAETDNSAFTSACVRAGIGVGIVAGQASSILSRGLVARPLRGQLGQAWIVFVWKKGKHLTVAVRTLMRLIREGVGSQ